MRIGVGLPVTIPNTSGRTFIEWAREADRLGFALAASIGRLTFPAMEELVAFAAAAAVTERIEFLTNVQIEPARDAVELAKQAATLDNLSNGRFILGMGAGWRDDDFTVTGRDFHTRGRRMDEDIEVMLAAWRGERVRGSWKPVSPRPVNGTAVPMVFGGNADAAFRRTARYGIGWTAGGGGPQRAGQGFARAREEWAKAGREGEPRLPALVYYGIGEASRDAALGYLTEYYGDMGSGMAQSMPVTPEALTATVSAFEAVGATDLVFVPTSSTLDQLTGLATAVLDSRS